MFKCKCFCHTPGQHKLAAYAYGFFTLEESMGQPVIAAWVPDHAKWIGDTFPEKTSVGITQTINYCPFCGCKLRRKHHA